MNTACWPLKYIENARNYSSHDGVLYPIIPIQIISGEIDIDKDVNSNGVITILHDKIHMTGYYLRLFIPKEIPWIDLNDEKSYQPLVLILDDDSRNNLILSERYVMAHELFSLLNTVAGTFLDDDDDDVFLSTVISGGMIIRLTFNQDIMVPSCILWNKHIGLSSGLHSSGSSVDLNLPEWKENRKSFDLISDEKVGLTGSNVIGSLTHNGYVGPNDGDWIETKYVPYVGSLLKEKVVITLYDPDFDKQYTKKQMKMFRQNPKYMLQLIKLFT